MAGKRSKKGNIQVPVAVRGSKTSELKLPNNAENVREELGLFSVENARALPLTPFLFSVL